MNVLRQIIPDNRGAVIIETAFVVPILLLMAVGAFEAGNIFSRQVELQNAAAEAAQIALSAPSQAISSETTLKEILKTSTGLTDADIAVADKYRCGTDAAYVDDVVSCPDDYASFVEITLTDRYTPIWASIAFGEPVDYNVVRLVQIG